MCDFFPFPSRMRGLLFTSAQWLSVWICQTTWESIDCFCWDFLKIVSMGWCWMKVTVGWTVPETALSAYGWLCHWFGLGLAYAFHLFTFAQLGTVRLNIILIFFFFQAFSPFFSFLNVNFERYTKMLKWLDLAYPIIQTFRLNTELAAMSLG